MHSDDRFNVNGQMAQICEETGGEMITGLLQRVGMVTRKVGIPDGYLYEWSIDTPLEEHQQRRKDFIDEVVELLHEQKWRDVGYPYVD